MDLSPRYVLFLLLLVLGLTDLSRAQRIDDDDYLKYVPLDYPRLTRQTDASVQFQLFGNAANPGYRDVDPVDGIDDERGEILLALSQRFAPFMVQNTFSIPMDHRKLMGREPVFNMYIDTWDLGTGAKLVGRETLDFNAIGRARCTGDTVGSLPLDPRSPDCRLVELTEEFDAENPLAALERSRAMTPREDRVKILYFDFPGYNETTWKEEYHDPVTGHLRASYQSSIKTYSHPFITDVIGKDGRHMGYEFVIQYWFYYPLNDGGNNHEGDWEHIDVLITPRSAIGRPLNEDDVHAILRGEGMTDEEVDEQLVIERVEYYFHHQVMTLDYTEPNVYLTKEEWDSQVENSAKQRYGARKIWSRIRDNAYRDEAETLVNTHPIAYVGADNKGIDQILSPPGGRNQDSHGTFPFPGLYKTVGPAGSAEQVPVSFDHKAWFDKEKEMRKSNRVGVGRGHAVLFDEPEILSLVADWERVMPLVRTNPQARRDWAWMVLPVRWGFPASPSPLAGLIEYADMGNVGPIGPAYNAGWNRTGTGRGYHHYVPHALTSLFPVDAQDGFSNNLGFFNIVPALTNLPPLDLVWRFVALPFRSAFKRQDPLFFPEESVPTRFIGISGGPSHTVVPDNMWLAIAHSTPSNSVDLGDQGLLAFPLVELVLDISARDPEAGGGLPSETVSDAGWGYTGQISFYVGEKFVSSTGFRTAVNHTTYNQPLTTGGLFVFDADTRWWDVMGNIRYNLATGGFKPYLNFGYGISWYRLENMMTDGELMEYSTGEWINNFWPPTWNYGFGAEMMLIQSVAPIPKGVDVGLKAEVGWISSPTGLELPSSLTLDSIREIPKRWVRRTINLGLSVSF